jgi:hypothetical protein
MNMDRDSDRHADRRDAKRAKATRMAVNSRSIFVVERVLSERAKRLEGHGGRAA